jgi:hypothetical protein
MAAKASLISTRSTCVVDHPARARAGIQAGRAARRDAAIAAKRRFQPRQRLSAGVRPVVLVFAKRRAALAPGHLDGGDLCLKMPRRLGGGESLL